MSLDAPGVSPEALNGERLLDVRRAAAFEQSDAMIPGATWFDPQTVAEWAASLRRDEPVVVYCVHGHEVSQGTALRLREAGLDARFLLGGIEGWKAAGRPLRPKGKAG